MREIFDQISTEGEADPTEAARRAVRPVLRKRFYGEATVGADVGEGFPVLLDGRTVRTPARRTLAAPSRPLAAAIAAEWQAQADTIDPAAMPLTRLANSIIDGLCPEAPDAAREAVAAEVAKYLASDLLIYRAGEPEGLVARQEALWDPVLAWAHERLGTQFILSQGVVFAAQPERTLAAARAEIPADPWRLGAVHAITTLTGSALLALALLHGALSAEDAWAAAHVDEDWNMQTWGRDELALKRRAFRWAEMQAAATVLRLSPVPPKI